MARKRNYKEEYRRRLAKGLAAGKSRQEARGHKTAEHVERARKVYQRFGVSPAQLTRLRKRVVAHVVAELTQTGTKGRVNERTIRRGIQMLRVDTLQAILEMDGSTYKLFASMEYDHIYDTFDDAENEDERNPFWYH